MIGGFGTSVGGEGCARLSRQDSAVGLANGTHR
jgi:hypothetical protein